MNITIISASVEDKGKYSLVDLAYKTAEGKVEGRKVVSFGDSAPAYEVLKSAQQGESYDIKMVKGEKYWNWVQATKMDGSTPMVSKTNSAPSKGNYETPPERAERQVYIIRQSSLSTAVQFLNQNKKGYDLQELINTAKSLQDWVMSKNTSSMEDLTEDILF